MTRFTEGAHPGEAIMSEGNRDISRENVIFAASQTISANGLVSKLAVNANVDVTTAFSGTGDGAITMADPAVNGKAKDGVYKAVCIEPATDAGKFEVSDPNGKVIGVATVGVAFNKEIKFTIADGATDFVAGDTFDITVAANSDDFQWVAFDPDGTDGSEIPAAMSIYAITTGSGETVKGSVMARMCVLNGNCVSWPDGITTAQKADAIQALAENEIHVRY